MISSIIRYFDGRTMRFKLTAVFLMVILVPMVLLAYISYRVIDARLMADAKDKLNMGLKSALSEYYVRGDQMRYGMLQAASMGEIRGAAERGDKAYLRKMMARWKAMRPYVDVWGVVGREGRVIARLNSDYSGDVMRLDGMVDAALASGEPVVANAILTRDELKFEGNELAEKIGVNEGPAGAEKGAETLALVVVTPVLNARREAVGAIITADVLNNDNHVPETLSSKIPGLVTSITAGRVRVATNITDYNGRYIKGTRLDDGVMTGLKAGASVFSEWSLGDKDVMMLSAPLNDYRGGFAGSIGVGISKERLWAVQKENQRVIVVMTLMGLVASLVLAYVSTNRIIMPLKSLKDKIAEFAAGDMSVRMDEGRHGATKDEINMLARTFNVMMDEVSSKENEKERHRREIEGRNREATALNDELKKANEELEVAYEETQSQTEELHAINEELKLLNEDLDRKNAELKKANLIISLEEEEIKRAKDKLRLIYDSIMDFILMVDYDHAIVEANRYFMERFRLSEAQATGRNLYAVMGVDEPGGASHIRRAIDSLLPVESEMTTPEGKVYTLRAFPLKSDYGEPRKAVVYIRDITEHRLLSHRLIQSDKLSSLGELVSGVAHELNNPLTGIMCFSELLMDDGLAEDVRSKIAKINDASHRCKKIIDNLLTFARWKRPEKKYEDVNRVIRNSVDLRAYQLSVDNIEVAMDLDEGLPMTMLDENQIQQVLLNLINNARDAVKEKGEKGRISISSRVSGLKIIVKVEDTGRGMPEEVVNRIFDPFFTTKGVGRGTGLGLSISYGIIHEHGGNIYASSSPGIGATFVVELPIVEDSAAPASELDPRDRARIDSLIARTRGLKALILDDEPIVLELLNEALVHSGFDVDRSSSGEEALAMVREKDYDIIVSDIKMPGLDGKGFYREVKRVKPSALGKIVFISGDSLNKDTQEFLLDTGNASLKKPFTVEQLSDVISRVIR